MGRVVNGINDLKTCRPDLLKEWDFDLNTEIAPDEIAAQSNKKVWWKCKKGHSYQAWLNNRTGKRKTGCPYCAGKRKLIVN